MHIVYKILTFSRPICLFTVLHNETCLISDMYWETIFFVVHVIDSVQCISLYSKKFNEIYKMGMKTRDRIHSELDYTQVSNKRVFTLFPLHRDS